MSLRDVLAYVQQQQRIGVCVTPVTPENSMGLQPEPAWIGAVPCVTPVTPRFDNTQVNTPNPAPEPTNWLVLDQAYMRHHLNCAVCKAAGRGVRYGLRCGVGAALWVAYTDAARAQPPPWEKRRK